ncbi:Flavin-dependent oxidoreductase, luciferase family (includes alkanesulfonate monooxygenase SsuD and methylene tetrahydromethanopterin reductase) [Enhydrobacter aerosaccus]|uniref:Flavin-dependent oxidoreductase, luciferase family (Includes alkanesulfonate monooxygenase SsuD and methylene tetrahydromethanopterin reductase) n=1 Tax=Enhydrobacter aerosaccus TaxID=225324 RepID=A0A1T4LBV8_9HYPH|nr:LLM class flavin-dependent oxidoreductase [Enhydrobacter aerosaccus]SJZ52028.1 Flavin-dependent oxidoreductase, luciferase family (includes alkanesulfonate monooxygenase SsuD and methylene tetrahydromethanopterin reductase) [Enhydrobacter aerosaccus]
MKFAVFDHLDRSGPDLGQQYEDRLKLVELYEWAGFHAYHVAEHHGTPLGAAPSPGLFLAAVAQRTSTLRFGPLAYPLGLYHPLRLIEEICMLDVMSRGRLELGVGRGASPYEASFFGVDPASSQERFEEILEILQQGLGTARLTYNGKFFSFKDVPLVIQPVQRPHPPLWHVTRSIDGADRLARLGCNVALALPTVDAGKFTARYRAAWQALGNEPEDMPFVGNTRNVVVLDSDRDAVAAARRAFHVWYDSMVHLWRAHGVELPRAISTPDFDEAAEQGYIVAGSPSTVRDRLIRDHMISGINYSICRFACGDLSFEESARSVRLFAREVMPALVPQYEPDRVRGRQKAAVGAYARGLDWIGADDLSEVGFLFR